MSDTIKWSTAADKEKTRLTLECIMKWTCFQQWEDYAGEKHRRIASQQTAIAYPVAFWNDQTNQWSVFYQEEQDARTFDPLHSLDAAWLIVAKLNEPVDGTFERYARFVCEVERLIGSNILFGALYHDAKGPRLTAERLCLAALHACGVEVEP